MNDLGNLRPASMRPVNMRPAQEPWDRGLGDAASNVAAVIRRLRDTNARLRADNARLRALRR